MQILLTGMVLSATVQLVCAAPAPSNFLSDFLDSFKREEYTAEATPSIDQESTDTTFAPQTSPFFPDFELAMTSANEDAVRYDTQGKALSRKSLDLKKYPEPWTLPDIYSPQVQAVINVIDWNLVPDAQVRTFNSEGSIDFDSYDSSKDKDCWWSASNCVSPKVNYLPDDIYTCPRKGEWGLTFDDGPFNVRESEELYAAEENPFAEPELYNFLEKHNIKSNLFYIGSNVAYYPAAAKRAFDDGHYICSHTWSHPPMTTLTNAEVVAELYWTLRAIKEATGITPRCWRPPQGDVDDRVRAIAWQMGMRTILWDKDTEDWALQAPGGGSLSASQVDKKFSKWLREGKSQTHGTIVLQHELNSATIRMAEKWLPKIKNNFNVVPASACNDVTRPYWEEDVVYPAIH
ncbi:hypothetical protein HPULCUR_011967 [Helicostylum pulchrum]|uniref:NodB homology domain-containing protein n=1 Tax=Helicostylum pulchrum TaxID=562976 RepID=A0ABP9YHL3_9FUNG